MVLSFSVAALGLASLLFPVTAVGQNVTTRKIFNPILPGAHPDPSCIHVPEEDTFFCASSSFNIFPGIPIHASKDLTTWKLIGEFCFVWGSAHVWCFKSRYRGGMCKRKTIICTRDMGPSCLKHVEVNPGTHCMPRLRPRQENKELYSVLILDSNLTSCRSRTQPPYPASRTLRISRFNKWDMGTDTSSPQWYLLPRDDDGA